MNRRARYSIFMQDELLRRIDENQRIDLWEFMQLFFPDNTNKKQFDCGYKFMKNLLENKSVKSSSLKSFLTENEYNTLMTVILPKLLKFGLVKVVGERKKGKSYRIELEKTFSDRIRHLGMEWFRIYTRYGDAYGG